MYQYEKFLKRNQIIEDELPAEIKQSIDKLLKLDYELDEEDDDAEIKDLTTQIKSLDKELVELITEWADDESDEDLPEEKVKENILSTYSRNGLTKIKLVQLKQAGYKFPSTSKWIERIGAFKLEKNLFADFATLTKIA
jgi:agmatine/peptidylarginine deiminase